jgi:uncharacterized protein
MRESTSAQRTGMGEGHPARRVPTRPLSGVHAETPREITDLVGRGLAWPLQVDHTGGIALNQGPSGLDSSIRLVLRTAPGERVMRPDFGCRVHELVFEPVNPNTLGLMRHAVLEALARWEPRITVDAVEAVPDTDSPALVHLHVAYRIRTTNDRRNLVHPFYLIPQEDA